MRKNVEGMKSAESVCKYVVFLLEKLFPLLKDRLELCFYLEVFPKDAGGTIYRVTDSRNGGWGEKKQACWHFKLKNASVQNGMKEREDLLRPLVLEELSGKFTDLVYFEELEILIEKWMKEDRLQDRRREYFFGMFLDKEQFVHIFVKHILSHEKLPNRQLLMQVSAQFYEKRPLNSNIYFVDERGMSDLVLPSGVKLSNSSEQYIFGEENLRTIRKLMEAGSGEQGLLVERSEGEDRICMFASVEDLKSCKSVSDKHVEFRGHLNWKVCMEEQVLIWYREGVYYFPEMDLGKESWEEELKDMEGLCQGQRKSITQIVEILKNQRHGTSLVFLDKGSLEEEVERLSPLGRIHEVELFSLMGHKEQLMGFTAIDGALMVNLDGECRAIGSILDGDAVIKGNPGRGSRYNSLANYVKRFYERKGQDGRICFAVVLSEDGFVNVVK